MARTTRAMVRSDPPKAGQMQFRNAPRATQERPRAPQEAPERTPRAPKSAPRGLPKRPRELLETLVRFPNSKQADFARYLSRSSCEKRVENDFSSMFDLRVQASNLISTRPQRVEMRFGSLASDSTHLSEKALQKRSNRPWRGSKCKPRSTKIAPKSTT